MKIYQVGGCVRDRLLGRPPKDIDYVVVGATPEQMHQLGYEQVGASFPVFLKNGCEYALARTERKTGVGYTGFETTHDTSVTLEEDLRRRDLTINSMAWDEETNTLIDPFNGQDDLELQVLRHTSEAFAEDPVRVLRTARFAARYGFHIDPETQNLMSVVASELDHVPQERIWQEIEKGLMERYPGDMFDWLYECGALNVAAMKPYRGVDTARLQNLTDEDDLVTRFTLVANSFKEEDYPLYRVPTDCARTAIAFNKHFDDLMNYDKLTTKHCLEVLYELRAFSGDENSVFQRVLKVLAHFPEFTVQSSFIEHDYVNAKAVNAGAIAEGLTNGIQIRQEIFNARLATL